MLSEVFEFAKDNVGNISIIILVIIALIEYYKWNKTKNLVRITDQREKWREELRKIARELMKNESQNTSSYFSFKKSDDELLTMLKVRINTMGYHMENNHKDYFLKDGYLWELIKRVENASNAEEKLTCKKKLVDGISLLLKYDWERSKNEINNDRRFLSKTQLLLLVFIFILLIILLLLPIKMTGLLQETAVFKDTSQVNLCMSLLSLLTKNCFLDFIGFTFVFVILPLFIPSMIMLLYEQNFDYEPQNNDKFKNFTTVIRIIMCYVAVGGFYVFKLFEKYSGLYQFENCVIFVLIGILIFVYVSYFTITLNNVKKIINEKKFREDQYYKICKSIIPQKEDK